MKGRRGIVCAASRGLGRACAVSLAREGVALVINARSVSALEVAANEIAGAHGVTVEAVAGDITEPGVQERLLAACPEPDILINNAGGPPPGDFRDWDEEDWLAALKANMLTPIALMKAVIDGMAQRGFGRIVNITSSAVKAPIAELGLSNGARAGLTGFVAGTSRAVAGSGVTINNLLPGRFDTERMRSNLANSAKRQGREVEAVTEAALRSIPVGRFGHAEEFGELCAFLCSAQAAYITGQNILIDGGAFPGTL